jgi:short-subunit dehydrogenase
MKTNYQTKKGTALITGASSGIGEVYADRLAKRGYDLILVARDQKKLESLAKRLAEEAGIQAEAFQADLTSKADLARVEKRLVVKLNISGIEKSVVRRCRKLLGKARKVQDVNGIKCPSV